MSATAHLDRPLPSGTVTFLFTDIEGSTRLWEQFPSEMGSALARHDALLRAAIRDHGGYVFATGGDAFCAAFDIAPDALAAARDVQRELRREDWPAPVRIQVRMALHTGAAEVRDNDYFGQPLNRVARLLAAAHGGQVLLSLATGELVRDSLPEGVALRDLGEHRLKDLIRAERVYQLVARDLPGDFPPLRTLDARNHNLPIQLTSFVGREREMREVKALLHDVRLVTLTGAGGAGKTRLSLQVGADLVDRFGDGVWFVELAPLTLPSLVPQAVMAALGVKEPAGRSATGALVEHLENRELLLLLDNCEHLIDACAHLCRELLAACAGLRILATSREALRVPGERSYRVPSLATPDPNGAATVEALNPYAAVQLFIERAVAVRSDFRVDNANAPAVASLCHHLDGIPLAIELAAARLKSMGVEEVNRRLDERFRLLTGGARTSLPRQQTLRSAIDWSYDLLGAAEQVLFCRLSVFAAGWRLQAAERACGGDGVAEGDVVDLVSSLVDKSLVVPDERDRETRYRLLETVREYARGRLRERGDEARWRNGHLFYYAAHAEEIYPKLDGPEQARWIEYIAAEHDNLRAALAWSSTEGSDVDAGLRLARRLRFFWQVRGHDGEGRKWLSELLGRPAGDPAIRAGALGAAGSLAMSQGDYPAAAALHEESLAIRRRLGDRHGIANALADLALARFYLGEYTATLTLLEDALAMDRELDNRDAMATSLNTMGMVMSAQADFARARATYEESLVMWRRSGNRQGLAYTLVNVGRVATIQGDYANARTRYEEGLAILRELGHRRGVAYALMSLAELDLPDEAASARKVFEQSLVVFRELGDQSGIGSSLADLAGVAGRQGDFRSAQSLLEQSLAVHRETGDRLNIAQTLCRLGVVAAELGDTPAARIRLAEAATMLRELGDRLTMADVLRALAQVACIERRLLQAARIWGSAERLRQEIHVPVPQGDRPDYRRQIAAARAALADDAAFDRAWQEGRATTLEETIQNAFAKPGA